MMSNQQNDTFLEERWADFQQAVEMQDPLFAAHIIQQVYNAGFTEAAEVMKREVMV